MFNNAIAKLQYPLLFGILFVLIFPTFLSASESDKNGNSNVWIAEVRESKGIGPETLIVKWVKNCAQTDKKSITDQRNMLGLVQVDLLDGLAYLEKSSSHVGDRSVVVECLLGIVADTKRENKESEVAILGLLFLSRDSQSIDVAIDRLLSEGGNGNSDMLLKYIGENIVLTHEQSARIGKR